MLDLAEEAFDEIARPMEIFAEADRSRVTAPKATALQGLDDLV
jgi:hypothetical protein